MGVASGAGDRPARRGGSTTEALGTKCAYLGGRSPALNRDSPLSSLASTDHACYSQHKLCLAASACAAKSILFQGCEAWTQITPFLPTFSVIR